MVMNICITNALVKINVVVSLFCLFKFAIIITINTIRFGLSVYEYV